MTAFRIRAAVASLAGIAAVSGCSSASAPVASPALPVIHSVVQTHSLASFYNCPSHGSLKYVSDYNNNVINVYSGNFNGQAPCGALTSHVRAPWGMSVDAATHDLYVANDFGHDVIVFHRGQMAPYDTYKDPSGQDPVDVVLAPDGTVIASNLVSENLLEDGSLSTWVAGPNGGTFVGNFPMEQNGVGEYLTVRSDGTVIFDKLNNNTFDGNLWYVACPRGVCGAQTQLQPSIGGPQGLAIDSGGDLRLAEGGSALAATFEFPHMRARTFPLTGAPTGIAINEFEHHWFVADGLNDQAEEYLYPGGTLIGIVAGNPGGGTFGVAVDPDRTR